jgi:hypothetical protein
MNKDNKNTELNNTDKKLHISDVMNSILTDLEKIKNDHIEVRSESSYDKSMKERMDGGISALDKAITVVKRYCS